MRVIVTAGPTREYIDPVRFITNASSGYMGCQVAVAAARAGHDVTLLLSMGATCRPQGQDLKSVSLVPFVTVADLKSRLEERFDNCEVLVMAAAVGDFRPETTFPVKLRRRSGPITLKLFPTEDILADLGRRKRIHQNIVAFAVEDAPPHEIEVKARGEMIDKNADLVVVNTPAAMAAQDSYACILSRTDTILPWATRPKDVLAQEIVALLAR